MLAVRAMVLDSPGSPLREADLPDPEPAEGEILVAVSACGVCRTDLHILDGELTEPKLPLVPGHQIVGRTVGENDLPPANASASLARLDGRRCRYCTSGRENLCDRACSPATTDGGYAELVVADERYCAPIAPGYSDVDAAPLLCAGLIGYRALKLAGDGGRLGLYGFGASAHIVCQVARHQGGASSPSLERKTPRPRRSP